MALVEGNLAVAETDLKEFIRSYDYELDYEIGNAYLRLGNIYDLQKRRPEAIACYRK
jgi:tetratricopeptide (TPR) repeat protein